MDDTDLRYLLRDISQLVDYNMPGIPPQAKAKVMADMLKQRVADEKQKAQQASLADLMKNYETPQDATGQPDYPYMEDQGYNKVQGGGYYVPPEERSRFNDEYTQYIQAKQALHPQSITAGGRTLTQTPTDESGQPYDPSAYTFTNADLIPSNLTGRIPQETQPQTRQDPATLYTDLITKGIPDDIAKNIVTLRQKQDRKVSFQEIPIEGKLHKVAMDEAGNPVKDYGEILNKDRIQILQTDEGYVEYNKDTKQTIPLGIKKPMTSDQQDTIEKLYTLKDIGKQLQSIYKEGYTGAVQGRAGWVRTFTGLGTTEDEQIFRSRTAELIKATYALSGKQISVQEMDRLKPFIPQVNDSDIQYKTKLKMFIKEMEDVIEKRKELFTTGKITEKKEEKEQVNKTVVERRKTKSGKTLVKYSDGTIGEE